MKTTIPGLDQQPSSLEQTEMSEDLFVRQAAQMRLEEEEEKEEEEEEEEEEQQEA